MTSVCPAGHTSSADDYCDVCGMPIEQPGTPAPAAAAAATSAPATAPSTGPPAAGSQACPNCDTPNVAEALFCENCGYDFTTGSMPRQVEETPQPLQAP